MYNFQFKIVNFLTQGRWPSIQFPTTKTKDNNYLSNNTNILVLLKRLNLQ